MKNEQSKQLLKELIAIPSYLDESVPEQNENALVEYLERWILENTEFVVERQLIPGGRYNLIIKSGEPEVLFLGHSDTVAPSQSSPYNQLEATEVNGEIWGRGAADMKSGLASLLMMLLTPEAKEKNFWILLYADEEYNFLGMKEFIKKYADIRPRFLISADGSDLKMGVGCRGLIEITFRVKGETGHPARNGGKSAIKGAMKALAMLEAYLADSTHPVLGNYPLNVAYILGGAEKPDSYAEGQLQRVSRQGNVVPDICECTIDIRPSVPTLRAETVTSVLQRSLMQQKLDLEIVSFTHDFGSWYTDPQEIAPFIKIIQEINGSSALSSPKDTGYLDIQMAWEAFDKPAAFSFGSGVGASNHQPDERIRLKDFYSGVEVFTKILKDSEL